MNQVEARPNAEAFLRACRWLLRPLIKAMIGHGVPLPTFVTLLKQLYVEVAQESFTLANRPLTDSRISMLTGVHRKDVRTLRETGMPATATPSLSIGATVIGRWMGDPRYLDEKGRPMRLARTKSVPSFSALVAEVSADVRPRTVLDELLRQAIVAVDDASDEVILLVDAFVPGGNDPAVLDFLAQNLHDHIAAATFNLLAPPGAAPFLERSVYYNGLTEASVRALEASARTTAIEMLVRLNGDALRRQHADREKPDATWRFRFGAYFYRTEQAQSAEADPVRRPRADGREA